MNTIRADAATTAATLFNDGVMSIQSYLNAADWISSASTCTHWFNVAAKTPVTQRSITRQLGEWAEKEGSIAGMGMISQLGMLLGGLFKSKPQQQKQRKKCWSLANHVTAIQISRIHWNDLERCCSNYPSLASLTIDCLHDVTSRKEENGRATSDKVLLSLPSSLRTVSIQLPSSIPALGLPPRPVSAPFRHLQSLITTIAKLSRLQSLTLHMAYQPLGTTAQVDWSPLSGLQEVEHLHFRNNCDRPPLQIFIAQISRINPSHLQSLTLRIEDEPLLQANHISQVSFPHLRKFRLLHTRVSGEMILAIAKSMPRLEHLEGRVNSRFDMVTAVQLARFDGANPSTAFPLFPYLQTFNHYYIGADIHTSNATVISAWTHAFSPLHFRSLGIYHAAIKRDVWQALMDTYPLLTSVKLASFPSIYVPDEDLSLTHCLKMFGETIPRLIAAASATSGAPTAAPSSPIQHLVLHSTGFTSVTHLCNLLRPLRQLSSLHLINSLDGLLFDEKLAPLRHLLTDPNESTIFLPNLNLIAIYQENHYPPDLPGLEVEFSVDRKQPGMYLKKNERILQKSHTY